MVEIKAGAEDVQRSLEANPRWEEDHDGLVGVFLGARDWPRAAVELEKLASLPHRPGAAIAAAVCKRMVGDTAGADSLLNATQSRLGASDSQMRDLFVKTERVLKERAGTSSRSAE